MGAATWTGSNGNFWLFGGYGEDAVGDPVLLNDLWSSIPRRICGPGWEEHRS